MARKDFSMSSLMVFDPLVYFPQQSVKKGVLEALVSQPVERAEESQENF